LLLGNGHLTARMLDVPELARVKGPGVLRRNTQGLDPMPRVIEKGKA
jgi:hypothetical protein